MLPSRTLDPATCRLADLTQHVRQTHHAYLRAELPAIWELLREAAASSPSTATDLRLFAQLFGRFRSTLENHLRKEEEVLFPFIEQLERKLGAGEAAPGHAFGPLALPIEILEAEHAMGDRLLDRMRPIWRRWTPATSTRDAPAWQGLLHGRLLRLEADMRQHVQLEDAMLFPRTIRMEEGSWIRPAGL